MELGIYHEFPVLPGRSQAECFAAGFDIVDASEEYGLDVMWLAELHFDKRRALAASPLVLGTAIAARTERIRIGTSVQVLPLANPLRIAEEAATLDHVSKGRLIFGVGRSGVVKTYEALNIAYSESKDREIECLEIIQRAWQEDNFSYKGKFYDIQDVTVVPQPVQQPTPEIRIAAVSVETFPAAGKAGQGLFLSVPTNFRALAAFRSYVTRLWRRALRRRSQRDRFSWARIEKLADDWLPKPRIRHPWPSDRFAVNHPRWEPYAGKPHVRFCAGGAQ